MKRIQAACLQQTLHFYAKEDMGPAAAAKSIQDEVAHYKAQLERTHTKYQIIEELLQPDGSVVLKIKKQYNNYSLGDYFA